MHRSTYATEIDKVILEHSLYTYRGVHETCVALVSSLVFDEVSPTSLPAFRGIREQSVSVVPPLEFDKVLWG